MIAKISPDIIHAMRIPYEGMLTASSLALFNSSPAPFLVSVWGNDFTLHAPSSRTLAKLTRQTLNSADGLHTDCNKDQVLARVWGFQNRKHSIVLPGAGGIQHDLFHTKAEVNEPIVINPRGLRTYVRNDTFFKAIHITSKKNADIKVLCPNMAGAAEVEKWVVNLSIQDVVHRLPFQTRDEMASLYQKSSIVVSPSVHDGTPNTLLEAMACGCFPIAGDIVSIREWITPGVNGLVFNPEDPDDLSSQICRALENSDLRQRARKHNDSLILEKAEYESTMKKAEDFYLHMIS
jgi:glycosyltransferase involved in cell wall biosynthesis